MKLSLFADDMIVYMENPIDSTKKLLDLINEFGKTAGYRVKTQQSKAFLYTNNETAETEIRKKIPFDIAKRKIKYLGINPTKEVKDLYSENYTTRGSSAASDVYKRQEIKGVQIGKEEMKLSLFADDMIVYMENPIDLSLIHISEPTRLS